MKKYIYYIVGLFFLLGSCRNDREFSMKVGTIDASLENIDDNNSVFGNFSLIQLETTDSCLLENIVKVDIQDDIYLLSSYGGKIYKFTKDGRYLWHLKQGNGPGELVFATDFFVDYSNQSIYVLDNYRYLRIYSFDGEYMKTEELPSLAFLFTKKNNSFLCFDPNLKRKSDFNFYVSKEGKIVAEGLRKQDSNRNVGYMPSNVFAFYSDSSIYIQHMLSDTIYSYSLFDGELVPEFFIYTKGLSVNTKHIDFPDSRSFNQICKEKELMPGVAGFSFLKNKIYLIMFYDKRPLYVVYDGDRRKSTVFTSLCKGFPNSIRCVGRNKNGIVYCYDMEELKDYADQGHLLNDNLMTLIKSAKLEDNPILVVFN